MHIVLTGEKFLSSCGSTSVEAEYIHIEQPMGCISNWARDRCWGHWTSSFSVINVVWAADSVVVFDAMLCSIVHISSQFHTLSILTSSSSLSLLKVSNTQFRRRATRVFTQWGPTKNRPEPPGAVRTPSRRCPEPSGCRPGRSRFKSLHDHPDTISSPRS